KPVPDVGADAQGSRADRQIPAHRQWRPRNGGASPWCACSRPPRRRSALVRGSSDQGTSVTVAVASEAPARFARLRATLGVILGFIGNIGLFAGIALIGGIG